MGLFSWGSASKGSHPCATCGAKVKGRFCASCGAARAEADESGPSTPSAPPWTRGDVGALRSALDAFERDERAMCRRGLWLEKGDVARKAVVKVFALGAGARVDGGQRTKSIASAIDAGDGSCHRCVACSESQTKAGTRPATAPPRRRRRRRRP